MDHLGLDEIKYSSAANVQREEKKKRALASIDEIGYYRKKPKKTLIGHVLRGAEVVGEKLKPFDQAAREVAVHVNRGRESGYDILGSSAFTLERPVPRRKKSGRSEREELFGARSPWL